MTGVQTCALPISYEIDTGAYPKGKNGLSALIQAPSDAQNWKGPYMKSETGIANDPWGHPYIYECPGKHNASSYDISSMGADGRAGTEDDVNNWQSKK